MPPLEPVPESGNMKAPVDPPVLLPPLPVLALPAPEENAPPLVLAPPEPAASAVFLGDEPHAAAATTTPDT
jgi:hypothetical protein